LNWAWRLLNKKTILKPKLKKLEIGKTKLKPTLEEPPKKT
jgi:hypothetical protein